ncbi:unnamed protein product [Laminaria digitata]
MHGNKALLEVDAGEVLDEALRGLADIRSLILPLGFDEVDVRAFRSGAVSGGVTSSSSSSSGVMGNVEGVLEAGGSGVDVFRVERAVGTPRP